MAPRKRSYGTCQDGADPSEEPVPTGVGAEEEGGPSSRPDRKTARAIRRQFRLGCLRYGGGQGYCNGGFSTYLSGSRHRDSRGSRARWSSF
jgi:hypothetical protein